MSESIIIGVDHGYAAMKTAHFSFHTGLVAHEHEPYTLNNVLEYGGKYYVVGSGRQPLQKDKTQTEDYYLLTLAAVAKELAYRNAGTAADIHLAAGLPLTSFGRDKKAFRDYTITISKVSLYPQGYAAALTQGSLLDEPSVIVADIGGWTVDLMRLDNRIPNAATCRSLELGMIRCLDEISEQIRRKRLLSAIAESGLDVRAMPAVFLGGGATLLKHHVSVADGLCRPIILDDVCLNAKGYERLTERMSKKHEQ